MMRRMLLASAATMGVVFLAAPVNAQGVQQTVPIAKVDVQTVAAGYRASKVIGSSVRNEANETIGKIDDLLVTRDGKEPTRFYRSVVSSDWAPTWWSCGMTALGSTPRTRSCCRAGRRKGLPCCLRSNTLNSEVIAQTPCRATSSPLPDMQRR